jgi:biotin carboxyl carrier protein
MERRLRIIHEGRAYIVTVEELADSGSTLGASAPVPHAADPAHPAASHAGAAHASAAAATAVSPDPADAASRGEVIAPLGGVIQSVSVTVGQSVNRGDALAVLEAMKMNTVLTAPRSGKVVRVNAKPGDAVESGQLLVAIE